MSEVKDFLLDLAALQQWKDHDGDDNSESIRHVKNCLRVAMEELLTEKQKAYLLCYFFERKKMPEIAAEFGVNKSTVSRTIKKGRMRLKSALRFSSPRLLEHSGEIRARGAKNGKSGASDHK